MGHSFGGAFTEVLLDRGLGAAGVGIDAAAVKGITKLPFAQLKSAFPVLKNPANTHRAVALTPSEFHYAFTNTMSEEASQAAFERYAVPGPGRVLFQGAFANFNPRAATHVDFGNDGPRTTPAHRRRGGPHRPRGGGQVGGQALPQIVRHHRSTRNSPGRAHFIIGQDGWEEVADYALDWAAEHARSLAVR